MQGKGFVKFFLIILVIVCLLQYIFMLPTRSVEKDADNYAAQVASLSTNPDKVAVTKEARINYLDSISSEPIFSIPLFKSYTYEELKKQQLALGLDLKGGMNIILQVDLRDFLITLSDNSSDPTFREALDKAAARQTNDQADFVTLFGQEFKKIANGKALASIFSRSATLKDEVKLEYNDDRVLGVIRNKAKETVSLTYKRLKDRIDKFGVTQPNVSLDANRDLIVVELPGIDNPERARKFLQASAKLEFWDVYRISDEIVPVSIMAADEKMKKIIKGDTSETLKQYTYIRDSLGNIKDSTLQVAGVDSLSTGKGPILSLMEMNVNAGGQGFMYSPSVVGTVDKNKRTALKAMFDNPEVKKALPNDLLFRFSAKPIKDRTTNKFTNKYEVYAIKKKRGSESAPLEGDHIVRAAANPDPVTQQVAVSLLMDNVGSKVWADMTTKASQDNNREIAIVLDDEVVSAPTVNDPITTGSSSISGSFTTQEGQDLANILEIGKLPAKTQIIQESVVGPSLGQENINKSILSLALGMFCVVIFMIAYYATGGLMSIVGLFINLFLLIGILASVGTVMTLPGIAGIVLTMAIAVDANVIIYERIKEELREGKSLQIAIADGFRNSMPAILDSNVTTIITALILYFFGLGPIKGFAVTLLIGVMTTLFTAILVVRLVTEWWLEKGNNVKYTTAFSEKLFIQPSIDWLGMRKKFYVVSAIVIIAGLVSFFTRGFELGVDFKGGYSYNIQFGDGTAVNAETIRSTMKEVFDLEPIVKEIDVKNTYNVTTTYLINDNSPEATEKVLQKLYEGVNKLSGGNLDYKKFKESDGTGTHLTSFSKVGPTVADDIKSSSFWSTILVIFCIFIYIFIRFAKWQFSTGTVVSLVHDALIILALFSFGHGFVPFTMEIDQAFIAAFLTILGYSMNDTIVVFDRIREYLRTYTAKSNYDVINLALNATLSRTMITSAITLFVVLMLFLFGGASIKGFAFALVVGVISGTYSSLFVATPVLYDLSGDLNVKETEAAVTSHTNTVKA